MTDDDPHHHTRSAHVRFSLGDRIKSILYPAALIAGTAYAARQAQPVLDKVREALPESPDTTLARCADREEQAKRFVELAERRKAEERQR